MRTTTRTMTTTTLAAVALAWATLTACDDEEAIPASGTGDGGGGSDGGGASGTTDGGASGTPTDGSTGGTPRPAGNFVTLEFTGPDFGGTLTYEFSGANAPAISTPNGTLVINKLINDPANWLTAKENATATCAQASLFTEITKPGTYTGADFTFTTAIDPEGNVNGRALRSKDQPGTITVTVFDDTRVEGTFETTLERTNTSDEPPPLYKVKATFGGDRR